MNTNEKQLIDAYGRRIDYLRISLTDKCNLRCRYCMPKEGISPLRHEEVLTLEEIHRVARLLTELGIRKIRITGGEPLVRRNSMELIRRLSELPEQPELVMTTNGVLLEEHLEELAKRGLRKINISLDTCDRDTYRELTGKDALDRVNAAIDRALSMGFLVKVNAVLVRGINEKDAEALAGLAKDRNLTVRFIELMPMGCAGGLSGVPGDLLLQRLEGTYGEATPVSVELQESGEGKTAAGRTEESCGMKGTERTEVTGMPEETGDGSGKENRKTISSEGSAEGTGNGPARYVRFPGFRSPVGFINPLSHQFCRDCNRIRLTVDGRLKLCLFYPDGLDLREPLRSGCTDEEIKEMIRGIILLKPERHEFVRGAAEEEKNMVQIGG